MIHLTYETAYDPYHTAFRLLRICAYSDGGTYKIPALRILDFYLNFPHQLKRFIYDPAFHLPRGGKSVLKAIDFDFFAEPYAEMPDPRVVFNQMEMIQMSAMQTLCVRGIFDAGLFQNDVVKVELEKIPLELLDAINMRNLEEQELVDFLVQFLGSIELEGEKGLKARTHLLEHRYDTV